MNINYSYYQDPVPTDYIVVIAYKPLLLGGYEEVNRVVYSPPHTNPRDVSIFVPTPVVHLVRIHESVDGEVLGAKRVEFVATPSFDGPMVIPPLMIQVGGGRENRDPADDAFEVAIPSIEGNTISWVEQRGAGPLIGEGDAVAGEDVEWRKRIGGGIELLNGKQFLHGERYWIYFEPQLDGNVSAAVADLAALLDTHIQDHDNPHETTAEQVGLGNLPNLTSDTYQDWVDSDPQALATKKAVHDLWASMQNSILLSGRVYIGNIGAVVPNSNVVDVINQGSKASAVTVLLTVPVPVNYRVLGSLTGNASNFMNDANVTWCTRNEDSDSFALILQETSGTTQEIYFNYTLIKA